MRLIDADALISEIERRRKAKKTLTGLDMVMLTKDMPTVEAVPLEPLCVWLAGYTAPPQYALNEVSGDKIDPESLVYTVNTRAEAWKYHFRELMKSGLMDTEDEDARP